jgi:muramoyltetrapeptide carboxypeptidase LdcA involved in peptidoglycan recycling
MIIPKWIKEGDGIGVTALSDGVSKEEDRQRFENGKKQLEKLGLKVVMTDNVFTADEKGRSSAGKVRAKQFEDLIRNPEINVIFSAKGGNFLVEMLPFIDYDSIRKNPKWIQGYSDNTGILYGITTKLDIATAYGSNFGDFGMKPWEESVVRNVEILQGKEKIQNSFKYYQDGFKDKENIFEGYSKDLPVFWNNLRGEEEIRVTGRLLGGCLDVLLTIAGTVYEDTLGFTERYKEDGIVFYLESFDLNSEELMMGLWRLKEMGWFSPCFGIVFGRPMLFSSLQTPAMKKLLIPCWEIWRYQLFWMQYWTQRPQLIMLTWE